jgi:dTDP-4-amino-4,6-dideoxygalactose transaminase
VIPFVDLKAQYRSLKGEIDQAIQDVCENAQFVLGPKVQAFENEFAKYTQTEHAIGVNTGTSALHLALQALGVGHGDEVITVPFTFVATVAAIHYTGARPVYVDVDPKTLTMDPALLAKAITPKTKAILPVHLYGHSADMDPIMEIARAKNLPVVEDACQAHGAEYKGKRVGSIGTAGAFSFYPGKNLGAYGEGGAVTTSDEKLATKIRLLRDWGAPVKYKHVLKGYNYRLEGIQGAVLGVKLKYLDGWNDLRRKHAAEYSRQLKGLPFALPETAAWAKHVFHVYAIRSKAAERDAMMKFLGDKGVQTGIHYPICVHMQEAYADPSFPAGMFPHSEAAAAEVVSLPMFPELTESQIGEVASALKAYTGR